MQVVNSQNLNEEDDRILDVDSFAFGKWYEIIWDVDFMPDEDCYTYSFDFMKNYPEVTANTFIMNM